MQKTIEVVYEKGVFKPLEPVELKEGERMKVKIEERRGVLERYAGFIKLNRSVKLKEILELEDEVWQY
jgi:predicted DNA-binding antitoxin AbrB/MazE fold protein